jgi:rSAM/selenodomain-associated transferase 1
MQPQRSALLVFAKAPIPGNVKTRLVPLLGKEKAAQLQAAMITNIVTVAARYQQCQIQLWCAPDTFHPLFVQLQNDYPISLHVQQGDDLGLRMHQAIVHALRDADTAVVVGTDCPGITVELLGQAFQALNRDNDAVIAPAEDGGYVLLGLKKAAFEIFSEIDWGTDKVYGQTIKRFRQLNLTWESLHTQRDVDRVEDLKRLINEKGCQWHPQLASLVDGLKSLLKN